MKEQIKQQLENKKQLEEHIKIIWKDEFKKYNKSELKQKDKQDENNHNRWR
jgi:hypothetical protein